MFTSDKTQFQKIPHDLRSAVQRNFTMANFVGQWLKVTVNVGESFLWSTILNVQAVKKGRKRKCCYQYWPLNLVPEVTKQYDESEKAQAQTGG